MVLACSLKLIWCCLVPSVCSDSDEGYYIPPTQLPCLVVQNGSLGICLSGLLVPFQKELRWQAYLKMCFRAHISKFQRDRVRIGGTTPIPLMDPRRRRVQMEFQSKALWPLSMPTRQTQKIVSCPSHWKGDTRSRALANSYLQAYGYWHLFYFHWTFEVLLISQGGKTSSYFHELIWTHKSNSYWLGNAQRFLFKCQIP